MFPRLWRVLDARTAKPVTTIRRRFATRVAAAYAVCAGAWIIGSDLALYFLAPHLPAFAGASLLKGTLFLVFSTALLYAFVSREFKPFSNVLERERLQRAEESVREGEHRFRVMIEQSVGGAYMIQDDIFGYVNPRLASIFGYGSQELIGRSILRIVAPGDRPMVEKNIRQGIRGDRESTACTFTGLRKDGSEVEIGAHGARITWNGRPAIVGSLQDISERRQAERQIRRHVTELERALQTTMNVVAMLGELRDPYTQGHEWRTGEIAAAIAKELGLPARQVEGVRVAGRLHDVGKIAVPVEILVRPARLTPQEYELVKVHAHHGYEILRTIPFPWPIAEITWQHHERFDGSGYPRGLKGTAILPEARIIGVADTLESMAAHRPYRAALGVDIALAELQAGRGRHFDPEVADACVRLFRRKGFVLPESAPSAYGAAQVAEGTATAGPH